MRVLSLLWDPGIYFMNNRSWLPERELFENICMASRETDEEFKGGRRTKGRMFAGVRHGARSSARSSHMLQLMTTIIFASVKLIIKASDISFIHPTVV